MELQNKHIFIFVLFIAILYSQCFFQENYNKLLLKSIRFIRCLLNINKRGIGSFMRYNRRLNINSKNKILNNIIKDYNKNKKEKKKNNINEKKKDILKR